MVVVSPFVNPPPTFKRVGGSLEPLSGSFADLRLSGTTAIAGDRSDGGSSSPLGRNADLVSNSFFLPAPTTIKAWYLRSHARDLLKRAGIQKRLRFCGVKITPHAQGIGIHSRPDRPMGRFSGVCVCGQSICCPVCAPRIAAFRALDVQAAFQKMAAAGYEARLTTYTLPHTLRDSLGSLLDMLKTSWRSYSTGCVAQELRSGKIGDITGQEINWGKINGWHPHKHQLRFDLKGSFDEHLHRAHWLSSLEKIGRRTLGTSDRAFNVVSVGDSAGAAYISKLALSVDAEARAGGSPASGIGLEIASSTTKGKNIINLLAEAAAGDLESEKIWISGVSEIISRKITSLKFSRGFRQLCGIDLEKSDEQIALDECTPSDIYLGDIDFWQWRIVVNNRAELALCIAANQGLEAVNSFLQGLDAGTLNMIREKTAPLAFAQPISKLSGVAKTLAEIQREFDRPSGLTRSQIEGMKVNIK